jgi:hypothetical protein
VHSWQGSNIGYANVIHEANYIVSKLLEVPFNYS